MFLHVSNATKYCMFDVLLFFFHLSSSSFSVLIVLIS